MYYSGDSFILGTLPAGDDDDDAGGAGGFVPK